MATDSHPRTNRRCGTPARALGTVLAVAAVLGTGGCLFAEPERAGITVTNESNAEVSVFVQDATRPEANVRAGEVRHMGTAGREGTCMDWTLTARTAEGTVVSTFGPPVCDGDQWEITQEDVDTAVDGE